MKRLFLSILSILLLASHAHAGEKTICKGNLAVQAGAGLLPQESEFTFDLDRSQAPDYTINNFSGYFNVKTPFLDGDEITTDNGNLGKFSIDSLHSDPNYRPQKYKNWIRFKNVDASETDGLEHGMWGYLVLDLTKGNEFQGKYIFQAGYHIGGTLTLACRVQDPQ